MTGRLIDADRLIDDCNKYNAWDAQIVKAWVDDQPTAEAIPIDWIKKWIESAKPMVHMSARLEINRMIADWEKRKEE